MTTTDQVAKQLTSWQQIVLGVIEQHREPVTASEMGNHLLVDYGRAHRALQALEARGLIGANYTSGKRGRAYEMTRRGGEIASNLFKDED